MAEDRIEIPTHLHDGRPVRQAVVGAAVARDPRGRKMIRQLQARGVDVVVLPPTVHRPLTRRARLMRWLRRG